jgi:hypothetical protein
MKRRAPIRRPPTKSVGLRCVLCGSSNQVERHHIGGQNHIAWFTVPLCRKHHLELTTALSRAGVDMRYTPDVRERLRRARQATLVFLWMLGEFERESAYQ